MKVRNIHLKKYNQYIVFLALTIVFNGCFANPSMRHAKVSEVDGAPCFAVDDKRTDSFHLFSLYVWEKKPRQWKESSKVLWQFNINPPGKWVDINGQTCFLYGVTPSFAEGTLAEPLVPYQIYDVSIKADPQNVGDHVIAYSTEFCLKPNNDGKLFVQVIEWNQIENRRNYEACMQK
jgi:hypothetical protein